MSKYQKQGYETRTAYLIGFAHKHDLSLDEVTAVAESLGPSEDFDGLLSAFNVW